MLPYIFVRMSIFFHPSRVIRSAEISRTIVKKDINFTTSVFLNNGIEL